MPRLVRSRGDDRRPPEGPAARLFPLVLGRHSNTGRLAPGDPSDGSARTIASDAGSEPPGPGPPSLVTERVEGTTPGPNPGAGSVLHDYDSSCQKEPTKWLKSPPTTPPRTKSRRHIGTCITITITAMTARRSSLGTRYPAPAESRVARYASSSANLSDQLGRFGDCWAAPSSGKFCYSRSCRIDHPGSWFIEH